MNTTVRKAVFPVAGMGTRFLPATKANPKEMLPIVDKPLIQYAVEEAIASGIKELIFVTSSNKRAIEDHFDSNYELESLLKQREKNALLNSIRNMLPSDVSCVYVRQRAALGLGHAVLCAKDLVGNEPFAVILADDLIDHDDKTPCLQQLIDVFNAEKGSVLAVQPLMESELEKYGVVNLRVPFDDKRYAAMCGIVEKPKRDAAPSNFGVVGRYVLTPSIFDLLERVQPGAGGEIQLTDAIEQLIKTESVYALEFEGKRYDCGSKLGYLEATVQYALKHPELAKDFKMLLKQLGGEF